MSETENIDRDYAHCGDVCDACASNKEVQCPHPEATIDTLRAQLAAAKAEGERMRAVGRKMANVCYNLGQQSPIEMTPQIKETMFSLSKEWDALRAALASEASQ